MEIIRHGITDGSKGLPIISVAVTRGDIVHLCGVTPDPGGDIRSQTRQVLERIDRLLRTAGTDKSKLLTAQVWLSTSMQKAPHQIGAGPFSSEARSLKPALTRAPAAQAASVPSTRRQRRARPAADSSPP